MEGQLDVQIFFRGNRGLSRGTIQLVESFLWKINVEFVHIGGLTCEFITIAFIYAHYICMKI